MPTRSTRIFLVKTKGTRLLESNSTSKRKIKQKYFLAEKQSCGNMDLHGMLMQILQIGVIISTIVATTAAEVALAKPGCHYMCGDVKIPFPFGLTDGCYLNKNFHITCMGNVTAQTGDIAVKRISIEDHELRVLNFVSRRCYNKTGGLVEGIKTWVKLNRYTVSSTKNKFTVVGCDTYAYLTGTQKGETYSIGCMSLCNSLLNVVNGSCSGVGCCEVEIPDGLKSIEMKVRSYYNHTDVWDFNPCGYAFVAEQGQFDFSSASLKNLTYEELPMVLEWAIGNETCKEAARNKTAFACKRNSYCQDLETTLGYRCKCEQGYQGNPYHPDGCQGTYYAFIKLPK